MDKQSEAQSTVDILRSIRGTSEIQRLSDTVKFVFKGNIYRADIFYWPDNQNAAWDCDVYLRESNGRWNYVNLPEKSEKTKEKMLITTLTFLEENAPAV